MYELAIHNGRKSMMGDFPSREIPSEIQSKILEEIKEVLGTNSLSGYRGNWIPAFYGGKYVQRLERFYEETMGVEAISCNSATSGIYMALQSLNIKGFSEVIVTPWSMSCSASLVGLLGLNPVFADIEEKYFCLDPKSIREKITDSTKAIIVVDLFGQGFDPEIMEIAKEHNLWVIEDSAQAIGGTWTKNGSIKNPNGTQGHIGVFSFTQGKHISAGEGGMVVTKNKELALKCRMIRNHAEAVQGAMQQKNLTLIDKNLVGMNLRMTEMSATVVYHLSKRFFTSVRIGGAQEGTTYFPSENEAIVDRADRLIVSIEEAKIPFIHRCEIRKGFTHSYYAVPFIFDGTHEKCKVSRDVFIKAVNSELGKEIGRPDKEVTFSSGYIDPLYNLPCFYQYGSLPEVEDLQDNKLFLTTIHLNPLTHKEFSDVTKAFKKVYDNQEELVK